MNHQEFEKAGIEEIVVSCPECYHVLNGRMKEVVPEFDIKVTLLIDMRTSTTRGGADD